MNPRITSIENLIASDPGSRNIFGLVVSDQLRLAAQSLRLARRVGIVSGFFIQQTAPANAGAGETDGPPGAKALGDALAELGIAVDYITDEPNAPLFSALGLEPIVDAEGYLDRADPTHLVSIERAGRGVDGRYRNMRGVDITDVTAPLDEIFLEGSRRGLTTIGIGDGGNEIGMGRVFADTTENIERGKDIATVVVTDFCIVAGVSNWGAYGLVGALSVFAKRDLLPSAGDVTLDFRRIVRDGGAVDGVTGRRTETCDGLDLSASLSMLENIRRQIAPSPLEQGRPILAGILGYGETGRAAAALLARHGHRVCLSDAEKVTLEPGTVAAGVEAGGHSIEFLADCDLVVASPGVRADSEIISALHARGIPVMSEMELAYQLGTGDTTPDGRRRKQTAGPVSTTGPVAPAVGAPSLIAVTGTIGKRTTVELIQTLFDSAGVPLAIGGNRGTPLSGLLLDHDGTDALAVAVSSFQLETVVHFRPHVAILLNINEAHLDRHRTIAEYVRIKSRVFMNHAPDDVLILPFDDPRIRTLARKHAGRTFFISSRQSVDRGAWLTEGRLRINLEGAVEDLGPATPPYAENLLAAVLTARLYGIDADQVARAVHDLCATGSAP